MMNTTAVDLGGPSPAKGPFPASASSLSQTIDGYSSDQQCSPIVAAVRESSDCPAVPGTLGREKKWQRSPVQRQLQRQQQQPRDAS